MARLVYFNNFSVGFYVYFNKTDLLLVTDFYNMWWLLKEPFLATYSAMSNPLRRSRALWLLKEPF